MNRLTFGPPCKPTVSDTQQAYRATTSSNRSCVEQYKSTTPNSPSRLGNSATTFELTVEMANGTSKKKKNKDPKPQTALLSTRQLERQLSKRRHGIMPKEALGYPAQKIKDTVDQLWLERTVQARGGSDQHHTTLKAASAPPLLLPVKKTQRSSRLEQKHPYRPH